MSLTEKCKLYESAAMRGITGNTIRPGGFALTDKAVNYCRFSSGAKVLDIGCGSGATVEHLIEKYQLQAIGIDHSQVMLSLGWDRNKTLPLILGNGEDLPFNNNEMDGVFAECTLSLMAKNQTLKQVHKVLSPNGWLIISDFYVPTKSAGEVSKDLPIHCCLSGALTQQGWRNALLNTGFEIIKWEDHSKYLKEMVGKIIFTYGSMEGFWSQQVGNKEQATKIKKIPRGGMGYFLMIAQKL